ncbi:hypothetical protein ABZ070_17875 [Streptomyces sp. NPDC006283]|uniref:hypothetical protein n=1 Tax=Streptomyces sp. NPDC006283 TaxID=3156741 RepID=UPI0033B6D837
MPSKPVRREEDGTIAVGLWLHREGVFDSDAALRLPPAEAEILHAQLCYPLDDETATLITPPKQRPDCRKSILTTRRH